MARYSYLCLHRMSIYIVAIRIKQRFSPFKGTYRAINIKIDKVYKTKITLLNLVEWR